MWIKCEYIVDSRFLKWRLGCVLYLFCESGRFNGNGLMGDCVGGGWYFVSTSCMGLMNCRIDIWLMRSITRDSFNLQPVHHFADTQQTLLTFLSFVGLALDSGSFPGGIRFDFLRRRNVGCLLRRLGLLGGPGGRFGRHVGKMEVALFAARFVVSALRVRESLCGHLGHLGGALQLGGAALERTVLVGAQKVCLARRFRLAALAQSHIETLVICMCTTKTSCQF